MSPLNAYLKLFHALDRGKPYDAAALVRAYLAAWMLSGLAPFVVTRTWF